MNWYGLRLFADNRVQFPFQSTLEDFMGVEVHALEIGQHLYGWDPHSWVRSESPENDGDPEDVLGEHLGLPIFSGRLRQGLANVGMGDIQYLPIKVFRSTGEEIHGFEIANVITKVPALDYENSEMLSSSKEMIDPLTNRPKVTGFWQAALHSTPLTGHDIIRLVEFGSAVFVSERFAEGFRRGKFTGADLVPVRVT